MEILVDDQRLRILSERKLGWTLRKKQATFAYGS
jgi:hypothetical protein